MSHIVERRIAALEALLGTDTATQLGFLAGVTAGTAAASKALVLDGSGNIATITSATITTLTATTINATTFNGTVVGVGASKAAICSATISATSGTTGTTLTNVTGMTVALTAGTWAISAYLQTISTANSGLKLALAYSGTTTTAVYTGEQWNGTTQGAHTTTTTIGNAVAAATAVTTDASISGTIVVSTAGNLTLQFAQNASHADTTSVFINSNIVATRVL